MTQLDSILDEKVSGLDAKLNVILMSLYEIKQTGPLEAERADQVDRLISLHFKHTLEEVEKKYNTSLHHYIDTISTMLKIHADMISATNVANQANACPSLK